MTRVRSKSGRGDTRRALVMFRRFTVGQRGSFVGAVVLMAVEAVTAIAVPTLIGNLINFLKAGSRWQLAGFHPSAAATIPLLAAAIVGVTAVNSLADSMSEVSLAKAGRALGYNLRTALFAHLQKLSLAFHLRRSTGDVLTRITGDVQALEEFIADSVSDLVGSAMLLVGTLTYLFLKSWRIALLAVIIVPLLALVSSYFARRIKVATREQRAREGDLASTAQEMLTTISVIQTYGRADHEQQKFARESRSAMDALLRSSRLDAMFGFTVSVLEAVVIALVVLVGARLVSSKTIDAGLLVTFILLIQGMFKPTRRIIKQWNTVGKIQASVERIGELLDREPAVQDAEGAQEAPPLSGCVEFRDVSFAYQPQVEDSEGEPSRLTLRSVSFSLAPGDVVAIVGHSGAGKSTIAQLLPRLYDPQAGAVLLDGHDIRSFTIESLRSQISMVLQETILLRGTVAENIAYGREGATVREVTDAAKKAQAHDFITALPKGYETVLGERAATLSGGQRQRLAIARAFIRDTPILVLDEPTTGLDAQSSAAVSDALQTLLQGRSAVIVSHDLNLIRGVDRILVLSAGRILEEGTPADLMARGGLYADLYASQFGRAIADVASTAGLGAARVGAPAPTGLAPLPGRDGEGDGGAADRGSAFETVLMDAVPMPASNREFQHLTGWGVGVGRSTPAASGPDPLRSPALTRALPGLAEALDPAAMSRRLQQILSRDWELASCVPGKVLVDPPSGATLLYRLRLRHPSTGTVVEHLVAGHLFASRADAENYLSRLPALADEARGRTDLSPFAEVFADITSLGLVAHAYPLDAELPGLVEATDPLGMREALEQAMPGALGGLALESGRAEVTKYSPGEQCVLRYELQWRLARSQRAVRQVVYGKLFGDERGSRIGPLLAALRGQLQAGDAAPIPFLLPRFQSYIPGLRLALMEALPGTPQAPTLVRERFAVGASAVRGSVTAEEALATCARVAGTLHASASPSQVLLGSMSRGEQLRTLLGEVARLRAGVEVIASFDPAVAEVLHAHLEALAQQALQESMAPVLSHGDFSPSEILFDGPISSVFDLDSACAAEPGLDLGHFVADLAVIAGGASHAKGQQGNELASTLDRVFFAEYLRVRPDLDPDAVLARVAAYRKAALLDVALRSWRQLKPDRLRLALRLIDEPYLLATERV